MDGSLAEKPATATYSRGYLIWAMGLLFFVYTSNFIDRTILSVLQQPIKEELKLSDSQLGMLGGLAFAVLYSTLGIPIARLAERHSRKGIITASLVVWSAMTALCGYAQGYGSLFAFRVGVGIGEAGATPPAHSLIADYFPPQRRATALSIYSLGIPIGVLAGSALGGLIAQTYGWRPAFAIVGLPGLGLAVLTQFTLREPPRGHSEGGEAVGAAMPSLMDVVRRLLSRRSFVHVAAGAALASFGGYGVGSFAAPYFIRNFGLTLAQAGIVMGLIAGAAAAVGTLGGGIVADRAAKRDKRWYVWIPAIGLAVATPMYVVGYQIPDWKLAVAVLLVPPMLHYSYLGPSFGVMHNLVSPRMRATATALLFLVINLIGLGLGPTLTGMASDFYARHHFDVLTGLSGGFASSCPGGRALAGAPAQIASACHAASAFGVRWAIVTCAGSYGWAALHYWAAAKHLREDLASAPEVART
jgi:predicted MFS family arabinose efflux permease